MGSIVIKDAEGNVLTEEAIEAASIKSKPEPDPEPEDESDRGNQT